jgi:hypothetical protein
LDPLHTQIVDSHTSLESSSVSIDSVPRFARRLEEFAATLTGEERTALLHLLLAAMDPLDRIQYLNMEDVLTDGELAVLAQLETIPKP